MEGFGLEELVYEDEPAEANDCVALGGRQDSVRNVFLAILSAVIGSIGRPFFHRKVSEVIGFFVRFYQKISELSGFIGSYRFYRAVLSEVSGFIGSYRLYRKLSVSSLTSGVCADSLGLALYRNRQPAAILLRTVADKRYSGRCGR